jgi:hypothetical protein
MSRVQGSSQIRAGAARNICQSRVRIYLFSIPIKAIEDRVHRSIAPDGDNDIEAFQQRLGGDLRPNAAGNAESIFRIRWKPIFEVDPGGPRFSARSAGIDHKKHS